MNISFYAPFKPLDHHHPSGDLVTAAGIYDFLKLRGHRVIPASRLRSRWIYWKPWMAPVLAAEIQRSRRHCTSRRSSLWFTYHTYYKAPDVIGPPVCRRNGLPYVVFQGIYSTKRRRKLKTLPGFYLNRWALKSAQHVFTNKKVDLKNLSRIIPGERLTFVAPGLHPEMFVFDAAARGDLRRQWQVGSDPVVLSVAMFRPGVKAEGLRWVIRTCARLLSGGRQLRLVIVGDGQEKPQLQKQARQSLGERVVFSGEIPRERLYRYYSAADVFVFPGIDESLGMVYLEAQSCGLPVVAFHNAGVPEAVKAGVTGLLVPLNAAAEFEEAVDRLLGDPELCRRMGAAAKNHVRAAHDLDTNYRVMDDTLRALVGPAGRHPGSGKSNVA
jgi:glycosyltransferase involved in cell wall biosynthesis